MNQWEAVHGISAAAGRYDYIEDVASLAEEMGFGWAWWTWAGGNSDGFKGGQWSKIALSNQESARGH